MVYGFQVEQFNDDRQNTVDGVNGGIQPKVNYVLQPKEINVKIAYHDADGAITFYDKINGKNQQKITAASTTDEVVVEAIAGYAVGDTVLTVPGRTAGGTRTKAKILGIDPNTKTITLDTNIDVVVGDALLRLFFAQERCNAITRNADNYIVFENKAYFIKIPRRVEFCEDELNKQYLFFADAQKYVQDKFANSLTEILDDVCGAFWMGGNISGATGETLGIETIIADRQTASGVAVGHPDSPIIDASAWTTDDQKIKGIAGVVERASKSGIYNGTEKITFVVNSQMWSALQFLDREKVQITTMEVKNITVGVQTLGFSWLPKVQFMHDWKLDELYPYESVAFVLPIHVISIRTKENAEVVNENGLIKKNVTNKIRVTKLPVQDTDDISVFLMTYTFAVLPGGASVKDAYLKVTGFPTAY